jgi:hypothetical protein
MGFLKKSFPGFDRSPLGSQGQLTRPWVKKADVRVQEYHSSSDASCAIPQLLVLGAEPACPAVSLSTAERAKEADERI